MHANGDYINHYIISLPEAPKYYFQLTNFTVCKHVIMNGVELSKRMHSSVIMHFTLQESWSPYVCLSCGTLLLFVGIFVALNLFFSWTCALTYCFCAVV